MSLVESARNQTLEALSDAETEGVDYITEEYLEELFGGRLIDPDWEPESIAPPEGADVGTEGTEAWCRRYCWNPVRMGWYWYFKWYTGRPGSGSCTNYNGRLSVTAPQYAHLWQTGSRCGNGAYIYGIDYNC
jgi:hypothetical protein